MTATIGNRPATARIVECEVGHRYWADDAVIADGWYGPECAACCDFQTFSDWYKDEVGVRPRFDISTAGVAAWLRDHGADPCVDHIAAVR